MPILTGVDPSRRVVPAVATRAAQVVPTGMVVGLVALAALVLAALALGRDFATFGTETDFLSHTVPEGRRILGGEPLRLSYHPPLHAFAVAAAYLLSGDWFVSGLLIAGSGAVLALAGSYLLFRTLELDEAAVGAAVALCTSTVFLRYGAMATTDAFFLALFIGCLLLTALAARSQRPWWWAAAGACLGAALLTRANALSLLVLLAVPLLGSLSRRQRAQNFASLGGALLGVLTLWWGYAAATGSRPWTAGTYKNLALTYYAGGENRLSYEALVAASAPFDSLVDVLLHDPLRIARIYAHDGYHNTLLVFGGDGLLSFPLNLLALPGLVLLIGMARRNAMLACVLVAAATQFLLVNLKTYEPRYFLFVVPVLGAAAAVCWGMIHRSLPDRWMRWGVAAVLALFLAVTTVRGVRDAHAAVHEDSLELSESVPVGQAVVPPGALLLARKPHLGYYTGAMPVPLPDLATLDELRDAVSAAEVRRPVFVYFGGAERLRRPQFAELQSGDTAPEWLSLVGRSTQPGVWALYRVETGLLKAAASPD
jgi:hypothetical protein